MNHSNLHIYVDEIFSIYDQDNSGTLNKKQLTNFFNGIYKKMNDNQIVNYTHVFNALKSLDPGFTGKADKLQIFNILKKILQIPVNQTNTTNSIDSNKNYQLQSQQQINSKVMQHKYKIQQKIHDIQKRIHQQQRMQTAPSSYKTILYNKSQPFIILKQNQSIQDISFSQDQFKSSFIQKKFEQFQFGNNYKQIIRQQKTYLNKKQKQILNLQNNKNSQNPYNVKYLKQQQPRYFFKKDTQNLTHNLQRVRKLNEKLNDHLKDQNNSFQYDIKQMPIQRQYTNITTKSQKSNYLYPEYNANKVEQNKFAAGPVEQFSFGKQNINRRFQTTKSLEFFLNPKKQNCTSIIIKNLNNQFQKQPQLLASKHTKSHNQILQKNLPQKMIDINRSSANISLVNHNYITHQPVKYQIKPLTPSPIVSPQSYSNIKAPFYYPQNTKFQPQQVPNFQYPQNPNIICTNLQYIKQKSPKINTRINFSYATSKV